MKCVICKKEYEGHGNNAEPLAKGRCCNYCNMAVILERLRKVKNLEIGDEINK